MGRELTHFNTDGAAHMVDVSAKQETTRIAVASARLVMDAATLMVIRDGNAKKGDVLGVARIAGIMAAKRTHELIPLCHPLALNSIEIEFETHDSPAPSVQIRAIVKTSGRTGVEMEALTAASVSGLTIYDMCKAIDRGMRIQEVRLLHKSGGKSGTFDAL